MNIATKKVEANTCVTDKVAGQMSRIHGITRRQSLVAIGLSAASHVPFVRAQQAFPSKPIRLIASAAPGGINDLMARVIAERLSKVYGVPVVVENLAGMAVARAAPDGYTLMICTIAHNGVAAMYPALKYDPTQDLKPLALIGESAGVLTVNPSLPIKSIAEYIAYAKAEPGKLTYGSAGPGSANHMAGALFEHMTSISLTHVPYKGSGPAITDLIGGQISSMFDNIVSSLPHIRSGKLRALGVTSPYRHPSLPDVPTIVEAGVQGYASVPWYTVSGPKNITQDIALNLNKALNSVILSPEIQAKWEAAGIKPLGGSIDEAIRRNRSETEQWTKVIKAAKIVAE
jgi:tripartite-type tricarboxylate transporter receptor subunit TctC